MPLVDKGFRLKLRRLSEKLLFKKNIKKNSLVWGYDVTCNTIEPCKTKIVRSKGVKVNAPKGEKFWKKKSIFDNP